MKLRMPGRLTGGASSGNGKDTSALQLIGELTASNRRRPRAKTEARLMRLRNEAFAELDPSYPETEPPEAMSTAPASAGDYELEYRLPSIAAEALTAATIRAAFLDRGSLLVRGLLTPGRAGGLAEGIDRAFAGRDAHLEGAKSRKTAPWFELFSPAPEYAVSGKEWNRIQPGGGSVWAADSPRMMFELLEAFEEIGLLEIAGDYLGERPAMSMKKSVLRRVSPESGAAWHQDGAFLGEGIRTLNIWVAMTRCGDEAPGMDVLPRRLDEIVPTGTEGALFDWAVSDKLAQELLGDGPMPRPIFEPGDAVLFDHLCLHRTAAEPDMPKLRYATETWCFAPSSFPIKQIPIVV